jgi:MinD-like ATPase involved in chromosome partitioning or flagellar assembly
LLSLKDLESTVGLPVHRTLTNDFQTVIESVSTGKPLVLNSKSQYARELKALAAGLVGKPASGGIGKSGGLKRLFGGEKRPVVRSKEALSHA